MLPKTRRRFEDVEDRAKDAHDRIDFESKCVRALDEKLTKAVNRLNRIDGDPEKPPLLREPTFFFVEPDPSYLDRIRNLEINVSLLMTRLGLERCDKPATKSLCKTKKRG